MALTSGTKLGPYEIVAPLGAGGMGEVYRACDTRLNREVAIKVLPPEFATDAERLRRFEQEARASSALNHPNVLTIYDIGTQGGSPFLVMELLQGETLRSRLAAGALPLRKSVESAIQVAQGLAAAHEAGIVHRDLKPENIFICKDARVKILDFGLAKLAPAAGVSGDSATLDQTQPGVLLGTAGYMAPEQARGGAADERSDIFSFGATLYEMLSGRRAFQRQTLADTTAAILTEEPPSLSVTGRPAPAALERILIHCLEKEPKQRFQSARDLAFNLQSLTGLTETDASLAGLPVRDSARLRKWARQPRLWAVAALLLANLTMLAWWVGGQAGRTAGRSAVQFHRLTDFVGLEQFPAIAPDGKSVAFTSDSSGNRQIWIRLIAGGAPLQITHDAVDHLYPRWSHDSGSIIYFSPRRAGEAQGTLWEISALGGAPRRLVSSLSDGDISHDGSRLAFFQLNNNQVQLVVADCDGSNPKPIFQSQPSFEYVHPRWSADDGWIAYQHGSNIWAYDIFVVKPAGGTPRQLTHESDLISGMAWMRDGSGIIYSSSLNNTVLYLPVMHLWVTRLNSSAGPQQLTFGEDSYEDPDVGESSRILASYRHMQYDIWKYPVTGSPADNVRNGMRVTHQTGQVQTPTLSPDASEMAYLSDSGGHGNIWVMRLDNGQLRQLTYERDPKVTVGVPLWSPDGRNIAYARIGHGTRDTAYILVSPDGSNVRLVVKSGSWATWSPDSRWLYYALEAPTRAASASPMYKIAADGGEPVLVRTDYCRGPAVGPDEQTVYYVTPQQNVSGVLDYELRVARPENGPSKVLLHIPATRVPTWQGLQPVLSHNGEWLALPLNDDFGSNIWLATVGGELRRVTDFGERRTFVARRLAWSPDDRFIYAAVGEGDADVVLVEGLLP